MLGFIGKPAFFNDARYVNPEGQDVPAGEVGEIWLRGPNVFGGYWNRPEATERAFRDGYCSAGDMARRDGDGFYTLVDRKSNMIITGGENVYPREVEELLYTRSEVEGCAVVGVPDKSGASV